MPDTQRERSPDDVMTARDLVADYGLAPLVRARDLRAMGLTRTDADFVMRKAGTQVRFGRSVYAKLEDVQRVLREHEQRWPTRG